MPRTFFLRPAVTQDDAAMGTDETDLENETRINTVSVLGATDDFATTIDLDTTALRGGSEVLYAVTMDVDADLTEDVRSDVDALNLFSGLNSSVTTVELHGSEGQQAGQLDAVLDDIVNGGATDDHSKAIIIIGTEQMLVTAVDTSGSKTVLTVVRGYDGTTAAAQDTESIVDSTTQVDAFASTAATGLNNTTDPVTFTAGTDLLAGFTRAAGATGAILLCESEEMKVTGGTTTSVTVSRAHGGTSAAAHVDTTAIKLWFDTTSLEIGLDTAAATVVNVGDYVRFAASAERLKVTAVDLTNKIITVTRAVEGSAADIADNAQLDIVKNLTVTQYIDEQTTVFGVDDASSFAVGKLYKIATGGTEVFKVTRIDETNELIEVIRGFEGTTPAVIADNADIWSIYGPVEFAAAVAAATGTANWVEVELAEVAG